MRILGIDPGTRVAGYGIVEVQGTKIIGVAAGVWRLGNDLELPERLAKLSIEFRRVLAAHSPSHLCIELAFLAKNPRSALFLGHARGVVLSEAFQAGLLIDEVSATSAKKMLTNYGRADKESVARTIAQVLRINVDSLPLDATDALCIAYSQAVRLQQEKLAAATTMSSEARELLETWKKSSRKPAGDKRGFARFVK